MGDKSKIEWTDATVNCVTGCSKKRPLGGCKNCYAERLFPKTYPGRSFNDVQTHPERLAQLATWRKPRMVFLNSMGDTFHERVPDHFIRQIFATITATPHHIYQVLTKRIDRAAAFLNKLEWKCPRNLWIGASAEDQVSAEESIGGLIDCGGYVAVRFLSIEPMIGPISLLKAMYNVDSHDELCPSDSLQFVDKAGYGLDWVICGGESGPKARPMHIDWVRELRGECEVDGLPFFFKQWGEWGPAGSKRVGEPGKFAIVRHSGHFVTVDSYPREFTKFGSYVAEKKGKKANGKVIDGEERTEFPKALDEYRDNQLLLKGVNDE